MNAPHPDVSARTPIQDLARSRRAEMLVGLAWYVFSASLLVMMTTSSSALSSIRGLESWGAALGRFAILPALGALGGLVYLLRHQWRARAVMDRLVKPRVRQLEPALVFASALTIATLGWVARPVLDPVAFCISILLFTGPLVWIGLRASSRSTRWVWGVTAFALASAGVLAWLEIRYGPLQSASDADLWAIVTGVVVLAGCGVVLAVALLSLVLAAYLHADRAWDRGDLEAVAALSYGGLAEDNPLVLRALSQLGRGEEAEERFHRLTAALPLTGPMHVLVSLYADRNDPRAPELARAAVEAHPFSPSVLLQFARVFRRSAPDEALDAVIAAQSRGFGGASRAPVFTALEACCLANLGQRGAARRVLDAFDAGEHPIHAETARRYAAEARETLGVSAPS